MIDADVVQAPASSSMMRTRSSMLALLPPHSRGNAVAIDAFARQQAEVVPGEFVSLANGFSAWANVLSDQLPALWRAWQLLQATATPADGKWGSVAWARSFSDQMMCAARSAAMCSAVSQAMSVAKNASLCAPDVTATVLNLARRAGKARHHVRHAHAAEVGVGHVANGLARLHLRVGFYLVDAVDRRDGAMGGVETLPAPQIGQRSRHQWAEQALSSAACATRCSLLAKRGSSTSSGRPMARQLLANSGLVLPASVTQRSVRVSVHRGGRRILVGIARALAHHAQLLVLDGQEIRAA
jgi:hypothetical protein